jgi:hypothetical protein
LGSQERHVIADDSIAESGLVGDPDACLLRRKEHTMCRHAASAVKSGIMSNAGWLAVVATGGVLLTSVHAPGATPVLDQFNDAQASVFGVAPTDNWQQGVTAGISGTLSSISLYSYGGPTTFTVYINLGYPWQSDANDFETQVTRPWGAQWFSIDVSAANIQLTNGTHYVIGAEGESMLYGSDYTYTRGRLWSRLGSNPPSISSGDLAFATYMIPIPEPSTAALFLLACAAFVQTQRPPSISRFIPCCSSSPVTKAR